MPRVAWRWIPVQKRLNPRSLRAPWWWIPSPRRPIPSPTFQNHSHPLKNHSHPLKNHSPPVHNNTPPPQPLHRHRGGVFARRNKVISTRSTRRRHCHPRKSPQTRTHVRRRVTRAARHMNLTLSPSVIWQTIRSSGACWIKLKKNMTLTINLYPTTHLTLPSFPRRKKW
jgi:hypothetical protein